MTERESRPWWRLKRVWIPAAAIVLLVVVPVWVIRARGMAALREVRARHAAAGIGADPEDLLATLPEVDLRRQEAWRGFEVAVPAGMQVKAHTWDRAVNEALAGERELPRAEIRAWLDEYRRAMEGGAAILAEGPVFAGAAGSLDRNLPGGPGRWRYLAATPLANLLAAKISLQWFRLEALTAGDPRPALASIDGIRDAYRRPATLIDAMIGLAVADLRDRAFADLALAGRLPPEAEARWLAEEPEHLRWTADGYRGERLLFLGAMGQEMAAGDLDAGHLVDGLSGGSGGSPGDWVELRAATLGVWLHGPRETAAALDFIARTEAALRGGGPPVPEEEIAAAGGDGQGLLAVTLPNLMACRVSAVRGRTMHRMARLLVHALRFRRERGGFPADEAAFREWLGQGARLLDPGRFDQGIRYGRPAPGVVRIEPDLDGPQPELIGDHPLDPSRLPSRREKGAPRFQWSVLGIEIRFAEAPAAGGNGGK